MIGALWVVILWAAAGRLAWCLLPPNSLQTNFTEEENFSNGVALMRLTRDILANDRYDKRVRPVEDHRQPLKIHISMSLYQIIDVNEPAQNIKMNVWMIQKWIDEALDWNPSEYGNISTLILPHDVLWLPDTVVYNSVVMNPDETERYMNIKVDSLHAEGKKGALLSFLYPAIYTVTCRLNIRYFPYDQQNCTLTISSWTNSKSALDYYAEEHVNMASFIPNEEWEVISFRIFRHEYKYACCPEPWVILEASIILRRKPLYYVVNLIIPTSIITVVAITGFFTPASTSDDRTEKINLGITTLLAMSILMLMVSDQMPTTSEFVPLIAWFYLSIIILISIGTFLTSVILGIQSRRQYGTLPPLTIRYLFLDKFLPWFWLKPQPALVLLWDELNDHPCETYARQKQEQRDRRNSRRRYKKRTPVDRVPPSNNNGVSTLDVPKSRDPAVPLAVLDTPTPSLVSAHRPPPLPTTKAKKAWLRAGAAARQSRTLEQKSSVPFADGTSTPNSPSLASKRSSLWDNTVGVLTTPTRPGSAMDNKKSSEMDNMKRKRQCSLEWELLASVLDRMMLVIFTSSVIIVTFGMMLTGIVTQHHYEQLARDSLES